MSCGTVNRSVLQDIVVLESTNMTTGLRALSDKFDSRDVLLLIWLLDFKSVVKVKVLVDWLTVQYPERRKSL